MRKIHYDPINTTKRCECGCGQFTKIARMTRSERGNRIGEPLRFINGHNGRGASSVQWKGGKTISKGYVQCSSVLLRSPSGKRDEHQVIAERALGKPLPLGAHVHHIDGNPLNNANNNLVICQDATYHKLLHRRQKALLACGHADWRYCDICRRYDHPSSMKPSPKKNDKYRMVHQSHAGMGIQWD